MALNTLIEGIKRREVGKKLATTKDISTDAENESLEVSAPDLSQKIIEIDKSINHLRKGTGVRAGVKILSRRPIVGVDQGNVQLDRIIKQGTDVIAGAPANAPLYIAGNPTDASRLPAGLEGWSAQNHKPNNNYFKRGLIELRNMPARGRAVVRMGETTVDGRTFQGFSIGQEVGNPFPDVGSVEANVRGLGLLALIYDREKVHAIVADRLNFDSRHDEFNSDWVGAGGSINGYNDNGVIRYRAGSFTRPITGHIAGTLSNPFSFKPENTGVQTSLRTRLYLYNSDGTIASRLDANNGVACLHTSITHTIAGVQCRRFSANPANWLAPFLTGANVGVEMSLDTDNRYNIFVERDDSYQDAQGNTVWAGWTAIDSLLPTTEEIENEVKANANQIQSLSHDVGANMHEFRSRLGSIEYLLGESFSEVRGTPINPASADAPPEYYLNRFTDILPKTGNAGIAANQATRADGTQYNVPITVQPGFMKLTIGEPNMVTFQIDNAVRSPDGANEYHYWAALANIYLINSLLGRIIHDPLNACFGFSIVHDGIGHYTRMFWLIDAIYRSSLWVPGTTLPNLWIQLFESAVEDFATGNARDYGMSLTPLPNTQTVNNVALRLFHADFSSAHPFDTATNASPSKTYFKAGFSSADNAAKSSYYKLGWEQDTTKAYTLQSDGHLIPKGTSLQSKINELVDTVNNQHSLSIAKL